MENLERLTLAEMEEFVAHTRHLRCVAVESRTGFRLDSGLEIELLPTGKRRTRLEEWLIELEESFANRLLPVTKAITVRWAVLSVDAKRRGAPQVIIDGILAATAIEHGLTVVTRNSRDFDALGVGALNPWEAQG
jgi:predicted nucleic acid-binding protein